MSAAELDAPADLSDEEREAVEALLLRLADDEFVMAERYTEWQVEAPSLESDLALSNIAQDELGHGRLWYDALCDLGWTEQELVWERDPDAFRHSTFAEQPYSEGDWADPIVRGYLYDVAEDLRLDALKDAPYRPLVDPIEKIESEERYHLEHAQNWLERLCDDPETIEEVQDAVDRLFPYALTLFEPGEYEDEIEALELRNQSLSEMREEWLETVGTFLEGVGVTVPMDPEDDPDELLPQALGRDGSHTDHWEALHDDFTHTYHELERSDIRNLRGE
jgi:ring-1,2-phenylacetyl-CoA epoxidase subunit PaaC